MSFQPKWDGYRMVFVRDGDSTGLVSPIYPAVVILCKWFIRHRDNRRVQALVAGATATAAVALAGAVVVLTSQAVTDWAAAGVLGLVLHLPR
ncbi:hypothetical protein ACSVHC_23415 [Arthrobacter sp. KNU-44]|uniref:hypothetical protein n=1 Tax=unclassified Arthrobacter TaxID=235627 RepID=UPI003F43754E